MLLMVNMLNVDIHYTNTHNLHKLKFELFTFMCVYVSCHIYTLKLGLDSPEGFKSCSDSPISETLKTLIHGKLYPH